MGRINNLLHRHTNIAFGLFIIGRPPKQYEATRLNSVFVERCTRLTREFPALTEIINIKRTRQVVKYANYASV